MTVITARLNAATFQLDGKQYASQLVNVTLTAEPSGGGADRKALNGESVPETETYADTLTGTVIQDWPAPNGGLIGFTRTPANRGRVVDFTLTSTDPAGYEATGTVQIRPLDLTMDPNETAESALSWKILTLNETYPAAAP